MADVTLTRRGTAAWVTFDRPEAHNAMTFAMYDRLVEHCESVDAVLDRLETVRKPTIALVDGFAMGSGLAIAAACDLRVITPDAKFGMPIARTVGNCLSMANYARLAQALGAARLKDVMFRARPIEAAEALAIGFASELVTGDPEPHVERLCSVLSDHSLTTLHVTKEALRRARHVPEGDDLVLEAYGSASFRTNVARFLKRT